MGEVRWSYYCPASQILITSAFSIKWGRWLYSAPIGLASRQSADLATSEEYHRVQSTTSMRGLTNTQNIKIKSEHGLIVAKWRHIDGLVQERRNSIANALELRLSCTNPLIWWHKSGSTLAQVMACCLMACCLKQCWLIIIEAFRQFAEGNFTATDPDITSENTAKSPGGGGAKS